MADATVSPRTAPLSIERTGRAGAGRQAARFDIKRLPGFATMAMVCFFLLYLPIATLVVYAFNDNDSVAIWKGFSLRWYQAAWNNAQVIEASIRSFQIATAAAILATVAATMAALATTRVNRAYRGLTFKYAFINQPLMIPEIVTAVALLVFFSRIKIATGYTGLGYLIAAHTAFCIPFAYLPIRARLESMDRTLETAAADLYATPWRAFRRVTLPLLWPGILAGFMLAFVVSLDDVVITEFVKSGGQETLPTYMLGQFRRIVTPEINAISSVFLLLSITIVTVFFFISRKRQ
jgi:spermidine/putrescine transport system permease protein